MSLDRSISHAIEENNIETMRSLLAGTRYPGSIINQTLDSPNTPPTHKSKYTTLTYAIRLGRSEMLKVLLQSQNDTQWFRQQIKQSLLNSTLEYAVFLHANSYDKSDSSVETIRVMLIAYLGSLANQCTKNWEKGTETAEHLAARINSTFPGWIKAAKSLGSQHPEVAVLFDRALKLLELPVRDFRQAIQKFKQEQYFLGSPTVSSDVMWCGMKGEQTNPSQEKEALKVNHWTPQLFGLNRMVGPGVELSLFVSSARRKKH